MIKPKFPKHAVTMGIIFGGILLIILLVWGNVTYIKGYEEGLNIQYSNRDKWYCVGVQEGILSAMDYHMNLLETNDCKIINGTKQYSGELCDQMWRDYLSFKDLYYKKKAWGCK